jgi:hypothetical protein
MDQMEEKSSVDTLVAVCEVVLTMRVRNDRDLELNKLEFIAIKLEAFLFQ